MNLKIFCFFLCTNLVLGRTDEKDKQTKEMFLAEMRKNDRKKITEWVQWPKDKIMNVDDDLTDIKKCVKEDRMTG
jgi:hypothetical protein